MTYSVEYDEFVRVCTTKYMKSYCLLNFVLLDLDIHTYLKITYALAVLDAVEANLSSTYIHTRSCGSIPDSMGRLFLYQWPHYWGIVLY